MYNLIVTPRAQHRLKEIKKLYREEVKQAIEELQQDPFIGKPLTEDLTGRYSYRIHVYRIIYMVDIKDKIVNIIAADHRATVYS